MGCGNVSPTALRGKENTEHFRVWTCMRNQSSKPLMQRTKCSLGLLSTLLSDAADAAAAKEESRETFY